MATEMTCSKTVLELSPDERLELKQNMLCEGGRSPSYGELADADALITDEQMFEAYKDVEFTPDDFFCNQ